MKRLAVLIGLVLIGAFLYWQRFNIIYWLTPRPALPTPVSYEQIQELEQTDKTPPKPAVSNQPTPANNNLLPDPVVIKSQDLNLKVPFQPQAPYADWSEPYAEACEEASLIMVAHYLSGISLTPETMKQEIDEQVAWQLQQWGGHFDLAAAQTAKLAQQFYSYNFLIIQDLTADKIMEQLRLGRPVIIPAAGRELGNPYFRDPGPIYHMLVIKGFINDQFITNDPGTKRGADYLYDQDVLMAAIHDWSGAAPDGPKVGLVLYK